MRLELLPTEPFARPLVADARTGRSFSLLVPLDGEASISPIGPPGGLRIGRSLDAGLPIDHRPRKGA